MENSERLGGHALPGIEPGSSRLPVLSTEPHNHWWGQGRTIWTSLRKNMGTNLKNHE